MNKIKQSQKNYTATLRLIIQHVNLLSLDVVLGSLFSGAFAAFVFGAEPGLVYWIILPVSVWVIYKADHLLDVKRKGFASGSPRMAFIYGNYRILLILILTFSAISFSLALFYFDQQIIVFGLCMGSMVAVYLFLVSLLAGNSQFESLKPIFVSLIYTSGIWGVPFIERTESITPTQIFIVGCFFILALNNVFILLCRPSSEVFVEVSTQFKRKSSIRRFIVTSLIVVISACLIFLVVFRNVYPDQVIFILISMALLSLLIFYKADYLAATGIFRISAEFVFWLPGLILFWIL